MFESTAKVVWALKRYQDVFDPKSGSVIIPVKGRSEHIAEPFKPGFLEGINMRDELIYRMRTRLEGRERMLLVLWYIADLRPGEVARRIRVSRMHAYRLKKKALWELVDAEAREASPEIIYGGWTITAAISTNGNHSAPAGGVAVSANGDEKVHRGPFGDGLTNGYHGAAFVGKSNPPRLLA